MAFVAWIDIKIGYFKVSELKSRRNSEIIITGIELKSREFEYGKRVYL